MLSHGLSVRAYRRICSISSMLGWFCNPSSSHYYLISVADLVPKVYIMCTTMSVTLVAYLPIYLTLKVQTLGYRIPWSSCSMREPPSPPIQPANHVIFKPRTFTTLSYAPFRDQERRKKSKKVNSKRFASSPSQTLYVRKQIQVPIFPIFHK